MREVISYSLQNATPRSGNLMKTSFLNSFGFKDVPETVKFVTEAGIRVWMVTGDEFETAYGTACAAGICSAQSDVLHINLEGQPPIRASIEKLITETKRLLKEGKKFLLAIKGDVS